MKKEILAILDSEERYAYGLMSYMLDRPNLPFRIHIFTNQEKFSSFGKKDEVRCLLICEKLYCPKIDQMGIPHIIILSESGKLLNNTLHHINKFQACENIYKEIIKYYGEHLNEGGPKLRTSNKKMKIIGIYTPIGRCLQTTFAFALGQLLSVSSKTLYLNFERYSGLSSMLKKQFNSDISDLLYYFECAKEKLSYRIDSIVENVNGLDYIPPANIYQNLAGIHGNQWLELFQEMEKCTEYEYLILDLTDGMLDLWDILRNCDVIYTISKGDPMALAKIEQYEKTISEGNYVDILKKTCKCKFPIFQDLSMKFEELTKGELARYIKMRILPDVLSLKEDGYE